MDVSKELEAAAATSRERHALYRDSVDRQGAVMAALFPDGVPLKTPEDHARFGLVSMIVTKLIRYAISIDNPFSMPHKDSVHDLGVYAFMLEKHDAGADPVYTAESILCNGCGHPMHSPGECQGFRKGIAPGISCKCQGHTITLEWSSCNKAIRPGHFCTLPKDHNGDCFHAVGGR